MRSSLAPILLIAACSFDVPSAVDAGAAGAADASGASGAPDAYTGPITYYRHVKPILDAKCLQCHIDSGIAPFGLGSADEAVQFAGMVKDAVVSREMPPWLAVKDCDDYIGDRSLSDEQIATLAAWADGGRAVGDPTDVGTPLPHDQPRLTRVDREFGMPIAYTPTQEPDDYRCFLIPWEETEARYVTGFRAVPGNPQVVHHVIAFLATPDQDLAEYEALDAAEEGPGYTCFGGTGGSARQWIGSWAPGSMGTDMPPGIGIEVPVGSLVILQVHYNTLVAGAMPDRTMVQVKLDDTVDKVATVQPWTNPQWVFNADMPIAAGDADATHSWDFDPTGFISGGHPMRLYGAGLHMHQLGQRASFRIDRADGTSDCLLAIDDWDFHWQGSYGFRESKVLAPGDSLHMECHWDNSQANQPWVDGVQLPPRDVNWGEGTGDEMCLAGFIWTRE